MSLMLLLLLLLLAVAAWLPAVRGQISGKVAGNLSCYECNVFRVETGRRAQCQEYIEDTDKSMKNWIIVPVSSGKVPLTDKKCLACGTFVTWSQNHHRKPRGGDERQVTLVISRFCVENKLDSRFRNGGCVDNTGSHSYLRRCYCYSDKCNSKDDYDMTRFGP